MKGEFLSQVREPVLSALGGCKILRELSKLEDEAETKLSMKELAQRFENLALGKIANMLLTPYLSFLSLF